MVGCEVNQSDGYEKRSFQAFLLGFFFGAVLSLCARFSRRLIRA
jgi:hypothetical protein